MRFYLVDRIDEVVPGERVRGIKNVTMSEDFLEQHFPGHPVLPGTLLLEGMAQLAGFLSEVSRNRSDEPIRRAVLVQVEKAKFHIPCRPGDQVVMDVRLLSLRDSAARLEAVATVAGEKVAAATLMLVLRTVFTDEVHHHRREVYRSWTRHLELPFEIL